MNKIAIICPYFGKFPSNIELTLNSMGNNQFIDWFIFTDNSNNIKINEKFKNVNIINYTFDMFKELVKNKMSTDIKNVYKICDYKPTFGFLFKDYIKEYEFWGFCDLDVIFGNLKLFFNEERLKKYYKIYDLGHLSIFKNCTETIEAFKEFNINTLNYKNLFNSEYIFVLDETYDDLHQGINGILKNMKLDIYEDRTEFADIDIKYNNFYPHNLKKCKYYYFIYNNNNLYLKKYNDDKFNYKIAYIHLQQKKNIPVFCDDYDHFMILPKGFFNIKKVERKMFYKKNIKFVKYFKYRITKKIKNIKRNKEIGFHW